MTFRVIVGQHARSVAESIDKSGTQEEWIQLRWLMDQLSFQPAVPGVALTHPEWGTARAYRIGDLAAAWTHPGHNIVLLRVLSHPQHGK